MLGNQFLTIETNLIKSGKHIEKQSGSAIHSNNKKNLKSQYKIQNLTRKQARHNKVLKSNSLKKTSFQIPVN